MLSVGSALHHLLRSRLCTLERCQVPPLSESSAVNEGNPVQLGLVKLSPRSKRVLVMFSQDLNFSTIARNKASSVRALPLPFLHTIE